MKIGDLIVDYIDRTNTSQTRFAQMCDVSKGYISMLIKGENPKTKKPIIPTLKNYQKIASALGMSLEDLFNTIDDAPVSIGPLSAQEQSDTPSDNQPEEEPDYTAAATKAAQTLIKHNVRACPVDPLVILKKTPRVIVCTFTERASSNRVGLDNIAAMFGADRQDAITYALGDIRVVAFNQRLPYDMIQMALARELGHIVMGHEDQSLEKNIEEALVFARHLLCPRPVVRAMLDRGIMLSVESVGSMTGCYGRTLAGIRETRGASVPADLNKKMRTQFSQYVDVVVTPRGGTADFEVLY